MPTVTISTTEVNTTAGTTTAVSMETETEKVETRPTGPTRQTGLRTGLGIRKDNSTTRTRYIMIE